MEDTSRVEGCFACSRSSSLPWRPLWQKNGALDLLFPQLPHSLRFTIGHLRNIMTTNFFTILMQGVGVGTAEMVVVVVVVAAVVVL